MDERELTVGEVIDQYIAGKGHGLTGADRENELEVLEMVRDRMGHMTVSELEKAKVRKADVRYTRETGEDLVAVARRLNAGPLSHVELVMWLGEERAKRVVSAMLELELLELQDNPVTRRPIGETPHWDDDEIDDGESDGGPDGPQL